MMFAVMLVLLGHLPTAVLENEPSVVPGLLNPGRVKQLSPTPGGQWAYERPRGVADIGRDEATRTLSLGLPVGRQFCELRLTSMPLPQGTAGSLALSFRAKLQALPGVRIQAARKIGPGLLRHGATFQLMNNPRMSRFVIQWFQVKRGSAMIAHLEAPAAFQAACAGRAEALVLSLRRVGP
jgi:hypothetical protein